MSSGIAFEVRIKLKLGGLDFIFFYKLQSSSVQFPYSALISRVQEIRFIALTADLETLGQVLLLICRVLYCIHYCSLQAIFIWRKVINSHTEFRGPPAVSLLGQALRMKGCCLWRKWEHEWRIKVFVLLVSVVAVKLPPGKAEWHPLEIPRLGSTLDPQLNKSFVVHSQGHWLRGAVHQGHRLKFGPSWRRDSVLQLLWEMRLWIDVRGYWRAREGTRAEALRAFWGFSHTESSILTWPELSGNLKLRPRFGFF